MAKIGHQVGKKWPYPAPDLWRCGASAAKGPHTLPPEPPGDWIVFDAGRGGAYGVGSAVAAKQQVVDHQGVGKVRVALGGQARVMVAMHRRRTEQQVQKDRSPHAQV